MRMMKNLNLGKALLGVWLIVTGLSPWVHVSGIHWGELLSLLAVAAGVLILLGR